MIKVVEKTEVKNLNTDKIELSETIKYDKSPYKMSWFRASEFLFYYTRFCLKNQFTNPFFSVYN